VDEGGLNRVYLEQPSFGRRMTVLWNGGPQPRTATIAALGTSAQAMDGFGVVRPLEVADDGHIRVTLAPATANTIPHFPEAYFIGGEPLLVLESLPADYAPFAPTYTNLPLRGQS
ncbi:MAG TPA: hypothetical protein VGQ62_23100, partial [Chloroflexota bacterium]|nr:hypothetical protein [Chloroflexota bacterium]